MKSISAWMQRISSGRKVAGVVLLEDRLFRNAGIVPRARVGHDGEQVFQPLQGVELGRVVGVRLGQNLEADLGGPVVAGPADFGDQAVGVDLR